MNKPYNGPSNHVLRHLSSSANIRWKALSVSGNGISVVSVKIGRGKRALTRRVVVDTGFTMGIWMSKEDAVAAGGVLIDPDTLPTDALDRVVPGQATILRVRIPEAKVEADTLVFCPDEAASDVLLGMYFLNQVGASLTIGQLTFKMAVPNRAADIDLYDLGDHVIPLGRPARW